MVETLNVDDTEALRQTWADSKRILNQIITARKHYDLIIGDDTSGRIPALFIAKVLNQLYINTNQQPIILRFVNGNEDYLPEDFEIVMRRLKFAPQRILLVTDYIATGATIERFAECFNRLGFNYDIAALCIGNKEARYKASAVLPDSVELYVGSISSFPPNISRQPRLTGLHRYRNFDHGRVIQNLPSVRKTRREIDMAVERLVSNFPAFSSTSGVET